MEDNPDKFKLNVHNVFAVCLSHPVEVVDQLSKLKARVIISVLILKCLFCRKHRRLFLLEWQVSFVPLVSRSILNSIRWSLGSSPRLMTLTVRRTHLLIANQMMSLLRHVVPSRLNRKVYVPNLLSRKTAVVQNEQRLTVKVLVVKRSFQN